MHFFIHNSFQAEDIILSRPIIETIRTNFPSISITLECIETNLYLWKDLGLPIKIYEGIEYSRTELTPNCPKDAIFINIGFGVYQDIFIKYGMSYENQICAFNRQMEMYNLHHVYQLSLPQNIPMIKFYYREEVSGIGKNSIFIENKNEYLFRASKDFPQLIFYCTSKPHFTAPNIIDCSRYNLLELSVIGNKCIGFITKGSGINAATLTETNRYKPRCILKWKSSIKSWHDNNTPVVYSHTYEHLKFFLEQIYKTLHDNEADIQLHSSFSSRCKFLKYKSEIDECSGYLHKNGYVSHNLSCKDWDLAHILSDLSDGNFLDMGSSDSYILKNVVIKNINGEKFGIDLRPPDFPINGVKYIIGDLMNTTFPDNYFSNITCLSVIEHEVDFDKFASEITRLLMVGGKLYLTFDYWMPKITPNIKLYGLAWNILDKSETEMLIKICEKHQLYLVDEVDWSLGEAVIREGYYSPASGINYTFGMLVFKKKRI